MATPRKNPARISPPSPQPDESRRTTLLDGIRANRTGRVALKLTIALLGALVVAVGITLIPLPGPGWLIVIAGLGIWAVEFAWAQNLLHFTRDKVRLWTYWVTRQSWPIRLAIGAAGLVFVSTVVWLSVRYSLGVDLWDAFWEYVTTH